MMFVACLLRGWNGGFYARGEIGRFARLKGSAYRSKLADGSSDAMNEHHVDTDIFAISAALGRLSTFQQASMICRIMGGGMIPSAKSANLASSCLSVIGASRLPMAWAMKR
jgi:hypothetical protein